MAVRFRRWSELNEIYDIHTHILPGVDDGARTIEDALKMLEIAYADGVRRIILTPHYKYGFHGRSAEDMLERADLLCSEVSKHFADLELGLGCEAFGEIELSHLLDSGSALCLCGSRYVLTEYRPGVEFSHMLQSVNDLILSGYTPILAHIERYVCLRKDPGRVSDLVGMGAMMQVNAGSVLGTDGLRTKFFVANLLKKRLVSFVASDAHNDSTRPPQLARCARYVAGKYGNEYMTRLFSSNAACFFRSLQ